MSRYRCHVCGIVVLLLSMAVAVAPAADAKKTWPQYQANPFVIQLGLPAPQDSAGGIVAADVNDDGLPDYLATVPGHVGAYDNQGQTLWIKKVDVMVGGSSERDGLPGHHGPGLQVGDVDGDGQAEVLFLTRSKELRVVSGATGKDEWSARPPIPEGAERWEHLVLCNFRGGGDRDLLLQATNAKGYRMGRHLAAYAIEELRKEKPQPLWTQNDFLACAHNGARVADLNLDGRDEVLGGTLLGPDGKLLLRLPLKGHIDSIFVYDVRPDRPGLEVVALEESGGNRVFLFDEKGLIWETHHRNQEPQNACVGSFGLDLDGLQVWCRSRYNEHQKPFVFDARGKLLLDYKMDDVAPKDWTLSGVETIWAIDWTGGPKQLAAAKERHEAGDVAVFDPAGGKFVKRFPDKADRLYVADVSGDWREELVVLSGGELHVYHNDKPNPRPNRPRLWERPHYRRSKMTYNYYSP